MSKLKINNSKKKYLIKVPENIKVAYCDKKNILALSNSKLIKYLNLEVKILLIHEKKLIVVTNIPTKIGFKNFKKIQGTTVSAIKRHIVELSYTLFTKLALVGVGYRAFSYDKVSNQIYFKLGYSHLVYFKVPIDLNVFCHKFTKVFLYGDTSYNSLTQTASQIRLCKVPEVYKGKGILYDQEKITLKKGKKV